MAVISSNLTSGVATAATSATTASITPSKARLVLLTVVSRTASGDPNTPSITGNSLTWIQVDSRNFDSVGSQKKISLFRSLAAAPTAGTIAIDFAGQTQSDITWIVDQLANIDPTGSNGATAVVQSAHNEDTSGAATTLTATLGAFASANNATYAAVGVGNTVTFTPGTGFATVGSGGNLVLTAATEFRNDNDTTADFTVSVAGELGIIAVEVKAAALDQENSSGAINIGFGETAGVRYRAQGFKPTLNTVTGIAVKPASTGSKGLKFIIDAADTNSFPTGTLGTGLYSFTIPNAELSTSTKVYYLPIPFTVTTGNQYCYYLAPWDTGTDLYADDYRDFTASVSNPYADGKMGSYEAAAWSNNDAGAADMVFQVWGVTVTAATSTSVSTLLMMGV